MVYTHPFGIEDRLECLETRMDMICHENIGVLFKKNKEFEILEPVLRAYKLVCWNIFDKKDMRKLMPNEAFLSSPLWHDLIAKAKVAYEYFKEENG